VAFMTDMNLVIAKNILASLKAKKKKQKELAEYLEVSPQIMSKIMNGERSVSAFEMKKISEFLDVPFKDLLKESDNNVDELNIPLVFMGKISSEGGRKAVELANDVADTIIFYDRIIENGKKSEEEMEF
jgi:transcriptional regulator with XRE-family HTH domain